MAKRHVEIEQLLRWAYRDELSKRQTSSAEGIWDRLAQNGSLGGIDPDPGHGAAQRYAHFGLPHPDAETIEKAVTALPEIAIDWRQEADAILGELVAIADARRYDPRPSPRARTHTFITYRDKYADKIGWRTEQVAGPRDLINIRSVKIAALVTMHAGMGSRPDWREEPPRPVAIMTERGRYAPVLIGECRAKDLYTTGSHCPLRYEPSPQTIAQARADYLAWWRGLSTLAATLQLADHDVLPPAAPEYPWNEPEPPRAMLKNDDAPRPWLPLAPQRDRVGPPPPRPRHGPVTMIQLKRS
jgi:hypothetical protein